MAPMPLPASRRGGSVGVVCAGLLLLTVLAAPSLVSAQTAPPGVLDGLVSTYQSISASWLGRVVPMAQRTFAILATLEFAVSGLWWAFGRDALDALLAALLKKFMLLSFLYALLALFPSWVPAIVRGFESAGQTASGSSSINPSELLD